MFMLRFHVQFRFGSASPFIRIDEQIVKCGDQNEWKARYRFFIFLVVVRLAIGLARPGCADLIPYKLYNLNFGCLLFFFGQNAGTAEASRRSEHADFKLPSPFIVIRSQKRY